MPQSFMIYHASVANVRPPVVILSKCGVINIFSWKPQMEIKWKSLITLQSEDFILFYNYNSEIVCLSFT